MNSKLRQAWFVPETALAHAGGLADSAAGRRKYVEYLDWLQEDEPARKAFKFDSMSKGWVIGSRQFKQELVAEHREVAVALKRGDAEMVDLNEALRQDALAMALHKAGKKREDLMRAGKSEPWKVAIAAELRATTTATNRWPEKNLNLGALHEVSRKLNARLKQVAD